MLMEKIKEEAIRELQEQAKLSKIQNKIINVSIKIFWDNFFKKSSKNNKKEEKQLKN